MVTHQCNALPLIHSSEDEDNQNITVPNHVTNKCLFLYLINTFSLPPPLVPDVWSQSLHKHPPIPLLAIVHQQRQIL